jgi:hypothetical protein
MRVVGNDKHLSERNHRLAEMHPIGNGFLAGIAVLGGLISSTVLNLLFLPVIALRFGGRKAPAG